MSLLRTVRMAAAFRQGSRARPAGFFTPSSTSTFTHTPRRFAATKPRLTASADWITVTSMAFAATIPLMYWLLVDDDTRYSLGIPAFDTSEPKTAIFRHGPSPEDVTAILTEGSYTVPVYGDVAGVTRYDGTQLASNSQCEDYYTHGTFSTVTPQGKTNQWAAWAVFDGHAGWQTSELLSRALVPAVAHALNAAAATSSAPSPKSSVFENKELVQQAVTKAFVDLDDTITNTAAQIAELPEIVGKAGLPGVLSFADKIEAMMPAWAGSCALLSLYDPATRSLHVACTGDSRAVLGQLKPKTEGVEDGKVAWEAVPLSVDQSGKNLDEAARLNAEHPGEEDSIVKNGRVLGIAVSRAFGDCRWKWPVELQKKLYKRFKGAGPLSPDHYLVKTPPYLTAEPVVTTTQLDKDKPYFMILASDGLWDEMSSQTAVDLVGAWLAGSAFNVRPGGDSVLNAPSDGKKVRLNRSFKPEKHTTVQDGNAAVHLVRNSLGGNDQAVLAARLTYGPPFSRNIRDDITVQVVFFNMDSKDLPRA